MKFIIKALAVVGFLTIVKMAGTAKIHSDRTLHARWINTLQADVTRELDLYESRWGKANKSDDDCGIDPVDIQAANKKFHESGS